MATKEKKKIENLALWLFPLLLIVPNMILAFTEDVPLLYKIADFSLVLGIYLIIVSITRNIGVVVILSLPLIFYAGFQLVLLYLYGGGIIAVDMFLNVATTNIGEASELLFNLKLALIIVTLLYLPAIVWSVWAIAKRKRSDASKLILPRLAGWTLLGTGVVFIALCYFLYPKYDFNKYVFPFNAINNSYHAYQRTKLTERYPALSHNFSYYSTDTHPDQREIYVLVVGETSRADNWELLGYDRPTNPRLSHRSNLITYPKALSESNTTHKSVPLLLSYLDAHNFGDSIYCTKSIISAFNQAGFATAFISAQCHNGSFIDFFGNEAKKTEFIVDLGEEQIDTNLLPHLKDFIDSIRSDKTFIVLHSYGSHFDYNDRYPQELAAFQPCQYHDADRENRELLLNAYDNTIRYTDLFLDSICDILASEHVPSAVVYMSDHGEDIYDDSRGRFLHASPTPTYYQLHVPLLIWMSDEYIDQYPSKPLTARNYRNEYVDGSRSVFHTMLDLAGVSTPYFKASKSLVSPLYTPGEKIYLNDYNESVRLRDSGLKYQDFRLLDTSDL